MKESYTRPVYFDFTASWCKPCQKLKPVFGEMAVKRAGGALFCLVDIDELDVSVLVILVDVAFRQFKMK